MRNNLSIKRGLKEDIIKLRNQGYYFRAIANELKSYGIKNVHVKVLEDDLKYYGTKEIEEMFND